MAEKLIIRLHEDKRADWVRLSAQGQVLEGANGVTGDQMPEAPSGASVRCLLPGERCLLTQATLPVRQRSRLLRALPFALEEQLADNVEELHFAAGAWENGEVSVAVAAHHDMRDWLAWFEQAGLRPTRFIPEPLALPYQDGTVSILLEPGRAVLRWGQNLGGAFDLATLDLVLKQVTKDKAIHLWRTADAPKPRRAEGKRVELIDQPTAWLAGATDLAASTNLLGPPYAAQSGSAGLGKLIKAAAVLAGIWIAAQFAFAGLDYFRMKSEAQRLYQAQFELFERTFPETPVRDPVRQMRDEVESMQVLRGLGAQSGALALLGGTGQSLQASRQVTLESFNYRDGVLEFSLRSPDMAQLEALRQRIENGSSLRAELTGNTMTASGISGRIQITRGDAG